MILVPLAVAFLCLCVMQAWRKRWKNATLYLFAAAIAFLTYSLWAQSHVTAFQKKRIDELNSKVLDLTKELTETKNRTNHSSATREPAAGPLAAQ